MSKASIPLLVLAAILCGERSRAQVLYVDAAAAPGGNGATWSVAMNDLRQALARAVVLGSTEIWVADGTYRPHVIDPTVSFAIPYQVSLYGGFAGTETSLDQRDPLANATILDGDLNGDDLPGFVNYADNSHHVVTAANVSRFVLDGFTVRGGSLGTGAGIRVTDAVECHLANLTVMENLGIGNNNDGAGAWISANLVTATDCRFLDNRTTYGGGMAIHAVQFGSLDVTLAGCTFLDNRATTGGGVAVEAPDSGALDVTLAGCVFGRGFATTGAGVFMTGDDRGQLRVSDCVFEDNAGCAGGGLYLSRVEARVERSRFSANGFRSSCGLGSFGGGINVNGGDLEVVNSVFLGDSRGSIVVQSGGSAAVTSSTFFNDTRVGALRVLGGSLELNHVVAWGTGDQAFAASGGSIVARYSNVHMGGARLPGIGNLDADPLFANVAAGDVHLLAGSPCIDAGDPLAAPVGADFERDSRMLDGDLDGILRLDLGADEHARLQLEILGTPAPGNTLTVVTTGGPGLSAILAVGPPGTIYFQRAGTVFLRLAGSTRTAWPAPPSTTSLLVPPGLSGLNHAQMVAFGGGSAVLSNYVPLQF